MLCWGSLSCWEVNLQPSPSCWNGGELQWWLTPFEREESHLFPRSVSCHNPVWGLEAVHLTSSFGHDLSTQDKSQSVELPQVDSNQAYGCLPDNVCLLNYWGDIWLFLLAFNFLVELHEGDVQMLVEELWKGPQHLLRDPATHPHGPPGVRQSYHTQIHTRHTHAQGAELNVRLISGLMNENVFFPQFHLNNTFEF